MIGLLINKVKFAPAVRHRLSTKQLSHGYHKWLYGSIRDKILASLARYRALRIGKFPCAFWRLSARPGLTAIEIENYDSR
ncbi:hypothetical protein [Bathymodiolus japonicus methanotrophic gill symbiont]|uniref:hypothetical protein n=1 Tax=Bathymodiolus japonicus methanotrophic gill symbiont TaxID=113269 RepID=UPI001C8EC625|nr:hypothetical protein [Bathymodiolus japonicus methanotrophic gill symbiont]